jgi:hypothetical protein
MLQPSDPPQLVSSSAPSSSGEGRQLPQQAHYPYNYQQQDQYGHQVSPPQPHGYGPGGSLAEPAYGVRGAEQLQGDGGKVVCLSVYLRLTCHNPGDRWVGNLGHF